MKGTDSGLSEGLPGGRQVDLIWRGDWAHLDGSVFIRNVEDCRIRAPLSPVFNFASSMQITGPASAFTNAECLMCDLSCNLSEC